MTDIECIETLLANPPKDITEFRPILELTQRTNLTSLAVQVIRAQQSAKECDLDALSHRLLNVNNWLNSNSRTNTKKLTYKQHWHTGDITLFLTNKPKKEIEMDYAY